MTLDDMYEERVAFYTKTTYIFKVYVDHKVGAVEYSDLTISFVYDEEYISLVDCCEDFDWNNTYYFTGLKETDETELVVHHKYAEDSKKLLITLVDPPVEEF